MSELNDMSCREFSDVAAELALGVLTGRERAAAIAHLDQCDACRENVRQLTMTSEGLLELLPTAEPPAGFETRVLERIGLATPAPAPAPAPARRPGWFGRLFHAGQRPGWFGRLFHAGQRPGGASGQPRLARQVGWSRRVLAAAAVVVAVIAGGLATWGLGIGASSPASTSLASATLLSTSHQTVGKVFLYQGSPRWLYMSVDMPSGDGTVLCQVVSRDGQVTTVGSFRLADGHGYWGSPATGAPGQLTSARLVTINGTVLASASFHAT
jgi:Putative zinc-finger